MPEVSIVAIVLIVALIVSGCSGGPSPVNNTNVATGTPKAGTQPRTYGDLYDMDYFWNHVGYCRLAYTMPDDPSSDSTMTFQFKDTVYNGTSAREMIYEVVMADYNLAMDIFFDRSTSSEHLGLLGGRVRMPDPLADEEGAMIDVPVTPEMWNAQLTTNLTAIDEEAARLGYDNTLGVSSTPRPTPGERDHESGPDFDLSQLMTMENKLLDAYTLSSTGTEAVAANGKSYICTVYRLQLNQKDMREKLANTYGPDLIGAAGNTTDEEGDSGEYGTMTFWYSPEFPAMPLKYTLAPAAADGGGYSIVVEEFR